MEKNILLVEDEHNLRRILAAMLQREGFKVELAPDGRKALDILGKETISVVISDLKMPGMDGLKLLDHILKTFPEVPVIMMTAFGTVKTAVEAIKKGAYDYVEKPFDMEYMRDLVKGAFAQYQKNVSDLSYSGEGPIEKMFIGSSSSMKRLREMISKVAESSSTVLITGESGTGKELVARIIHEKSARRDSPFIKVNCGAMPVQLMESELFGYEKGAFTGAQHSKQGKFEFAHNGTLMLDEIGELSMDMQVKLLGVLQDRIVERIGGLQSIHVDVRIVTATNRDLKSMVEQGRFREDLFYRINVVNLHIPPVRERVEDIPELVEHFIIKYGKALDKEVTGITSNALGKLRHHSWPGNIREIENVIERAIVFVESNEIDEHHLTDEIFSVSAPAPLVETTDDSASEKDAEASPPPMKLQDILDQKKVEVEREMMLRSLMDYKWNITRAANALGVSREHLSRKVKEYGLKKEKP